MLQKTGLIHSSFRDKHKGVVFTIQFKTLDKAFKATLDIDGLDPIVYETKSWTDRDQALIDICAYAYEIIDKINR